MVGIVELSAAVVVAVSPYLPSLIKAGKFVGEKFAEGVAKKGADKAVETAGKLWDTMKPHFTEKPELEAAANLLSVQPDDTTYQKAFAKPLASLLQEKPELAKQLVELIGGEHRVQEILSDNESWVEDVTQELTAGGTQRVVAKDKSTIKNVRQIAK
jgi:hypothetical protein